MSNTPHDSGIPDHGAFQQAWSLAPASHRPNHWLLISAVLGVLLLALFVAAFWQVDVQFRQLDDQRMRLERSRDVVSALDSVVDRQRSMYADMLDALQRYQAGQPLDRAALDQMLATEQVARDADVARLASLLQAPEDRQRIASLRSNLRQSVVAMLDLVAYAERTGRKFDLDAGRRSVMVSIMATGQVARSMQAAEMELMRSRAVLAGAQLQETRRYAFGALLVSGVVILALGLLLLAYVNQRKRIEQRLAAAAELWSATVSSLQQGVGVYSRDLRLVLWNPRLCELQGIPSHLMHPGMHIDEIIRLSIRIKGKDMDEEVFNARESFKAVFAGESQAFTIEREDGLRLLIGLHPMSKGYCILTNTDVTGIQVAEQLAHDRAVRLDTIMNSVPDAIITINASGSIESWNEGAQRMFGYDVAEVLRRNVSMLMDHPHVQEHDSYLRRYLGGNSSGVLGRSRELSARRRDGSVFPIDLRLSEMKLGGARKFVGIVRDITERRAIEKLKAEFIATVSHELRTPLTSIMGSLKLLGEGTIGALSPLGQQLVGIAERNSERLARLVNDILDIEKVEAGQLSLQMQPLELIPLLQSSLDMNSHYGADAGVNLQLQNDAGDVHVRADAIRLSQVMGNLLSNAIKHSPPQAQVLVQVSRHDERVRVAVHDAGPGISDAFRSRVFERFAQADGSDAKTVSGTGLGLAIAKQLVQLQGGTIGFESGQSQVGGGHGATFWIELPIWVTTSTPVVAGASDGVPVATLSGLKVLLCEDDPDAAAVMVEMLRRAGCEVVQVRNGAQALDRLDDSVQVLLLDVDLPGQSGVQIAEDLRRAGALRALPVIVVSGRVRHEYEAAADGVVTGVHAWLEKPLSPSALYAALAGVAG